MHLVSGAQVHYSRTSEFPLFKADTTNSQWTKGIRQAQNMGTCPVSEGEASDRSWGWWLWHTVYACIHMWRLASGNLVSGSLNVYLRTQFPCSYNYSHCMEKKKVCWGFIMCPSKGKLIISMFPEKFPNTQIYAPAQDLWFPSPLNLCDNSVSSKRTPRKATCGRSGYS